MDDAFDPILYCMDEIRRIRGDSENKLESDRAEALRYYNADSLGNEQDGRSKYVTSDLADTVEWILPSLVAIFTSGDEVCRMQPRGEEDAEAVKDLQELINYQCRVRNEWFILVHDCIKDALLQKTGTVKYQWHAEEKTVKKYYRGLNRMELMAVVQSGAKLAAIEPPPQLMDNPNQLYDVQVAITVIDEYPIIEAVPPEEVGFNVRARSIDSEFFYHRVKYRKWEIKKKYDVDISSLPVNTRISGDVGESIIDDERYADLGGSNFYYDRDTDLYWVYECYYRHPDNGDPTITVICGDVLLAHKPNEYDRPPFRVTTPIRMSHRVIGRSLHDLLKDLQRLRTTLMRQMLDNIYFTNNGRYKVGPGVVLDDFLNFNRPGSYIRCEEGVNELDVLATPPLPSHTLPMLEIAQSEKENRSGITRYNQGLDSNSLNKTARGLNAIMEQSMQRIKMMATVFAETLFGPLTKDIGKMNIKFLTKKVALQVLDNWTEVRPDNLVGEFDMIYDVTAGSGSKDMVIAHMQQLLGLHERLLNAGAPVTNAQVVYNCMKELVKAMGYRNTSNYVADPKISEAVHGLIMTLYKYQQMGVNTPPDVMQFVQALISSFGPPPGLQDMVKKDMGTGQAMPGDNKSKQSPHNLPIDSRASDPAQPLNPMRMSQEGF